MVEKRLRSKVIKLLEPLGAFAVENPAKPGTPDVCTTMGWIELKLGTFAKTSRGAVRITLRNEQRIWLRKWSLFGGKAWVLTVINGEWFLHDGLWSSENIGRVKEEVFREHAEESWVMAPKRHELLQAIGKSVATSGGQ